MKSASRVVLVPVLSLVGVLAVAACGTNPTDAGGAPSAPPTAFDMAQAAKDPVAATQADMHSPSRVLGYVEGEVITYREVLQRVGPELAQAETAKEKQTLEDDALLDVVRERMMYRAAQDARVPATRDEIDANRETFVKGLAKNGGTLEAFLHEHDMTRREFDEMVKMQLVLEKYRQASIGHSGDAIVSRLVRPVTDTFVSPEDVRKCYDRNPDKFREPAVARCRMLTIPTDLTAPDREAAVAAAKAKAEAVLARLRAGEDWVPVYREALPGAAEPDARIGPDGLVEIHKGDTVWADWIREFAFKSARGTLPDPVQKGTTFHVLRAEGAHEERVVPFEEAEEPIRRELTALKGRLAWLEVQLTVLDESSVQPDSLRAKLRDALRQARQKLLASAGL
jgi:hypothetical protein